MGSRIPHLPEELHLLIGQFISRNDLPNYRLASKSCCAVITPELFGTLTFHFSTLNLERLRHIADNEHLLKNVKTLFLDINLWRIPNVRDYHEWKAYFLAKANSPWTAPSEGQRVRYESLAMDRPEWEAYLDKMIDEGKVRDSDRLLEVLEQFHNLQAIHIVHGTLNPAHRGIKKMSDQVDSISEKAIVLHRGEGVNDRHSRAGQDAFRFLPQLTCPRLRKLRLDRIHYTSFHYISPNRPPGSFLDSLRSLDLRITSRSDRPDGMYYKSWAKSRLATRILRQGRLKLFLMGLRQLECLKIDLNCYEQRWPEYQPMSCVQDAFGSDSVWPRLRKLSLNFFFATPNSLVDLCQRHSSTLKDLRLCNIIFSSNEREQASSFEVPGPEQESVMTPEQLAWLDTLESLGSILGLERATVLGKLGVSTPHEKAWNLDDDPLLAAAVSASLVRGGHCPLYDAPWI